MFDCNPSDLRALSCQSKFINQMQFPLISFRVRGCDSEKKRRDQSSSLNIIGLIKNILGAHLF